MSKGTSEARGLGYTTAVQMYIDHGDFSNQPDFGEVGYARLRSGLPFSLFEVPFNNPQEGRTIAAVAGRLEEFSDIEKYPLGPVIRMHSACIFSEVGDNRALDRALTRRASTDEILNIVRNTEPSLECDCRTQREAAQEMIAEKGGIYFELIDQEGRGAGLEVKRAVYKMHAEEGLDTAQAYERLGISWDTREYGHVAHTLLQAGIKRVQLLSNNPRKIAALEAAGIMVTPVELVVGVTDENIGYLGVKRDRGGHRIPPDDVLRSLIK